MTESRRRIALDALCVALLVLLTLVLYRKVLRLWWTYDDAYLLHIAKVHPASHHFLGGEIWRSMPQQLFTPLLTASYDAEGTLFGLDAGAFYAVQLVELSLAAVALYALLRFWCPAGVAGVGAALFIAGAPLCNVATELMLMHYIESVILGVVAVALFVRGVRAQRWTYAIASAIFFLAAMLAKEIVLPILPLLLLLPERDLRARMRLAIPHAVALGAYVVWRWSALGALLGGYGWALDAADVPALVVLTPLRTFAVFAGPQRIVGALLLIVTAAVIAAAARSRRYALTALAALVLAIAPTLPVAKEMQTRFAFVPWLCWSVLFAVALTRVTNARARALLALVALSLAVAVNRQAWRAEFTSALRMSDEARVFVELGPNDLLRAPAIPPAAMTELQWLKEQEMHRAAGTGWFYDDIYLCDTPLNGRRVFEYDRGRRTVGEATAQVARDAARYCAAVRGRAPLQAHFRRRGETLYWELGPYEEGRYSIVIADGLQAFPVPRRDGYRLRGVPALPLRIRYTAPEGWVTYSPQMTVDLAKDNDLRWRRTED